jgi:alanyl-tRNA synthetase
MSSERLYYTDTYLVEFDAVVRDIEPRDGRWHVTLDRTAFYPTSGGQPFDVGTLGEAHVLDVFDDDDARGVVHVVDQEIEKNSRVRGHIDWDRRFDHMQQHTGQHLLSAAFEREVGARTVSFHLGTDESTIDLEKELSAEQVLHVEEVANRVLWENREICVKFVTAAEAEKLPLRKDPARSGELRIVEIKDYDLSACGGTHVSRTGAIGSIAVSGTERFKGGLRVHFLCGDRARRAYRSLRNTVDASVRLLSVLPEELPAAIGKLQAASRLQQKSQDVLVERLAVHEAAALAAGGEQTGSGNLVAATVTGWDANGLKRLASSIVDRPATAAVLLSSESPVLVVAARSRDLRLDVGDVLRTLLEKFGGRGGGKGAIAQGGGLSGSPGDILNAAREALRAALSH